VLASALSAYRDALGSRLIAGYALGSLAHGGFSPLVSDVDIGLILHDPLRAKDNLTIRTMARSVRTTGSVLAKRLSVFWGTPSTLQGQRRGGRFPPLDRLDLLDHGRLLAGPDARACVARPGQTELLVAGAEFALAYLGEARTPISRLRGLARPWADQSSAADEIRTPSALVSAGPRRLTKIVLFPVRFLFTAETGRVGTNSVAAAAYLGRADAPSAILVAAALTWRFEPPPDAAATALLSRELIPLYLHYIDDHIARLQAVDHYRLAERFERFKSRLLE
jgi:hypothetical protein